MWLSSSQLFLALGFSAAAKALGNSNSANGAERVYTWTTDEIDTISHLASKSRQQDPIFSEAVQLLDSLKTSPSCHRIAANKLVTSCQSFDGKDNFESNTQETLDRIRSVYAARLAICELDGAGASVPPPCLPVTILSPAPKTRFSFMPRLRSPELSSEIVPPELLEQCLRALESRPQWWTSYSNNRQNAMVLCQASRIEIEQEQLLDLHRSVLKSSVKLDEGLQEAIRHAAMDASRHHAFVQNVRDLQDGLVRDIETTQSLFQKMFGKLVREFEAGIHTVVAVVTSASGHVQNRTAMLQQNIQNVSAQVNSLQQALQTEHRNAVSRDVQAMRTHQENGIIYASLATDLKTSLKSLVDSDISRLSDRVERFDSLLEWLTGRLILILEQENNMSQRLEYMQATIQESQANANELQQAQLIQAQALAAQVQTQHMLQARAQMSQALLDKALSTAANLHAIIDEAAMKYKQTPGFQLGGTPTWTLCIIALIIMASQSAKFAVSIVFLIFGHLIATTFLRFF